VHHGRAFLASIARAHHRRQLFVVDLHQLRGVARLLVALRDDDGDVVADVAHLALRKTGMRRLLHRLAVDVRDQPAAGQAVDLGRSQIVAREDRDDAGRLERLVLPDRFDLGVRVRRAHEARVGLVGHRHVVGVVAGPGEKAVVLFALDRSANVSGRAHDLRPHRL
jgi:hypothetical protein